MKASERVDKIADMVMDKAASEQETASAYKGNEIMSISCLGSARALLAMAKVLRQTAVEIKAEEAGYGN
jgi:hypothetical protein